MKILAVGGGTAGHVTPAVAVIRELKKQKPHVKVRFWCDKKFAEKAQTILEHVDSRPRVDTIVAGKLRRYHHLTLLQHVTIPTVFWPNVRDIVYVVIGTIQSLIKLIIWRPSAIFLKGGYVCLPVGWAAYILRIPTVIHDSDAHPGLTNRLLARFATIIATGAPLEYYSYPREKSHYVGVPINTTFRPYSVKEQRVAKQGLGFDTERPLVVVTGGGLGAQRLNDAVLLHLKSLLEICNLLLISGTDHYDEISALAPQNDPRFRLTAFISDGMADVFGAADVVVTRAGATSILELAAAAKPTIVVPNEQLTWQVKHAKVYTDANAVVSLDEAAFDKAEDASLFIAVHDLLLDSDERTRLARALKAFAKPQAAEEVAKLLISAAKHR